MSLPSVSSNLIARNHVVSRNSYARGVSRFLRSCFAGYLPDEQSRKGYFSANSRLSFHFVTRLSPYRPIVLRICWLVCLGDGFVVETTSDERAKYDESMFRGGSGPCEVPFTRTEISCIRSRSMLAPKTAVCGAASKKLRVGSETRPLGRVGAMSDAQRTCGHILCTKTS